MENEEKQKQRLDKNEEIKETGTLNLNGNGHKANIQLLTIIGEIEGHEAVSGNTKATKYEHLIPRLAEVEDDDEVDGVLILLNTLGGDVEAGLAIAEMIASLSKPTVSLVLGGSHSIGGPLAQDRITRFIAAHSQITKERLEELMLDSTQLVKDVGTMLEGEDAVREGMIDEVGGISMALKKLREMIRQKKC